MARSETRVQAHDVILLSSSPVLPSRQPLSTSTTTNTSRPAWKVRSFDLPLLSSDPPEAATGIRSGPSAGDTHSKYFSNIQNPPSSPLAATTEPPDLPAIPKEKPTKYVSGDLESALQRRRDWTPPPIDTVLTTGECSRSQPNEGDWSSSPGELVSRSNTVFKSLQTSYGCKEDESQTSNTASITARESSFTKRKAIEAISIGDTGRSASNSASPTKSKAPKKKVRTLTELAVAAYADSTVTGGSTTVSTKVATKRQLEVVDENLPLEETEVRQGFPTSKLRKLKTAQAAAKAKKPRAKKAPATRKPVLLSPESAREAATRQDFLFGTSSQLAQEHSPTFLRHLHTAMQASNQVADSYDADRPGRNRLDDIIDDSSSDIGPDISTVDLTGQRTPAPKKKLWGAAARGEDGLVTHDNIIDLEDAIEFPEDPHQVIEMAQRAAEEAIQKEAQETELPAPTQAKTSVTQATQSARGKGKQPAKTKTAKEVSSTAPAASSTAKEPKTTKAAKAKATKAAKEKEAFRPNFDILTTAQLTKKVSDYGYKTIKSRSAMITLLNECWDAQHPNAAPAVDPTPVAPSSTMPVTAQATETAAPVSSETAKTQPKPNPARVTKPATTKTASSTQPIRGLTASPPRAALFLPKGVTSPGAARIAAIHTTSIAAAKSTAKTSSKASASASASASKPRSRSRSRSPSRSATTSSRAREAPKERIVFEIDDSESDGRFSSPEPGVGPANDLNEDDIVATDLDEEDTDMDNDEAGMSLAGEPLTYEQSELFRYISTAVTSQPPTNDPKTPSWHEKILMYDTIILETFTAWLNDGPLKAAGYAGVDVAPADVKTWCESKSVCCTWRKNLAGKERKW